MCGRVRVCECECECVRESVVVGQDGSRVCLLCTQRFVLLYVSRERERDPEA